jgi:ketosteroid isomerase-like protein
MISKPYSAIAFGAVILIASHVSFASVATDTVAAFHAALVAGDKAKATELMATDALVYESGYVEASFAEYAGHHLREDMAFAKTSSRKVLKQAERTEGKLAIVTEQIETTGTSKGKSLHVFGTETYVLENQGGKWQIVHVHWSSRKAK